MRRWLPVTEATVQHDPEAREVAHLVRTLVRKLEAQWVPATALPVQLVHGDVRLSNVCQTADGRTVCFDFGFLARRPRVHDLAYSLAFMLLALGVHQSPDAFAWHSVPRLLQIYEEAARTRLTKAERRALPAYAASIPLYAAALDGFTENPIGKLRARLPFVELSSWLLSHPTALLVE